MNDQIDNILFEKIKETEKYYINLYPNKQIDTIDEPLKGNKIISNNKFIREHQDLKAFNYNLTNIIIKKKEKQNLINFNKDKIINETIISNITELENLEFSKPWNKMDNWLKRVAIKKYIDNLEYSKKPELIRLCYDLLKNNKFKKNGINIIYNDEKQLVEKIIEPDVIKLMGCP